MRDPQCPKPCEIFRSATPAGLFGKSLADAVTSLEWAPIISSFWTAQAVAPDVLRPFPLVKDRPALCSTRSATGSMSGTDSVRLFRLWIPTLKVLWPLFPFLIPHLLPSRKAASISTTHIGLPVLDRPRALLVMSKHALIGWPGIWERPMAISS